MYIYITFHKACNDSPYVICPKFLFMSNEASRGFFSF